MSIVDEELPRKGWFANNWQWFIPTLVVAVLALLGLIIWAVMSLLSAMASLITQAPPYQEALLRAQAHPEVRSLIGENITAGSLLQHSGSIEQNPRSGSADLAIPVTGTGGSGRIQLRARKEDGRWSFQRLNFTCADSGSSINLLE